MLTSPSFPRVDDPHWHSQPSVQLAQHSFSHAQSGQPSQQAPLALQVAFLLLQQPALVAVFDVDDVKPNVPAAIAASRTIPRDNFVNMETLTPVKRIDRNSNERTFGPVLYQIIQEQCKMRCGMAAPNATICSLAVPAVASAGMNGREAAAVAGVRSGRPLSWVPLTGAVR